MTTTPERTATLTALVAAEIRAQLGRLDVKPAQLARRLGENDQWLSTRLKGRTPINVNDLHRIANALGVGVHDLLPPPDVAARAAGPQATAHYPDLTVRPTKAVSHPRNRPGGPSSSSRPPTGRRTARLPRDKAA